jgi:hypothetical protein
LDVQQLQAEYDSFSLDLHDIIRVVSGGMDVELPVHGSGAVQETGRTFGYNVRSSSIMCPRPELPRTASPRDLRRYVVEISALPPVWRVFSQHLSGICNVGGTIRVQRACALRDGTIVRETIDGAGARPSLVSGDFLCRPMPTVPKSHTMRVKTGDAWTLSLTVGLPLFLVRVQVHDDRHNVFCARNQSQLREWINVDQTGTSVRNTLDMVARMQHGTRALMFVDHPVAGGRSVFDATVAAVRIATHRDHHHPSTKRCAAELLPTRQA